MTTYYRPPGQATARSTALTSWGSGALLTTWPGPSLYNFAGVGLAAVPLSMPSQTIGFTAAANDPSGNAWIVGYYGSAASVAPNGTVTTYQLPALTCFTGLAYCQGHPYFLQSGGALYTIASGAVTLVTGGFGELAVDLCTDGTKLYATLPASQNMGVFTLANYVSGTATKVTTPMAMPSSIAGSASGVAVAGWNNAALVSGAVSLSISPTGTYAAAVNTSTNSVMLLGGDGDPDWELISVTAGRGAPVDVAWASFGQQILVTDTVNASVAVYNLVNNAFVFAASIATTGAAQIEVTPDGVTALVSRTTANAIRILTNSINVWSTQSDITVTSSPRYISLISSTEAVASYVPAGQVGGLIWLGVTNGVWGATATHVNLPFAVSGMALDLAGQVYAIGTIGTTTTTGNLSLVAKTGIQASTSWTGRADAVHWNQGQVAVLDATQGAVFSLDGGVLLVSAAAGYPTTSSTAGAVWSNAGAVAVVPGITPNPSAPAVYYASVTPAQLLALGGGNLPLTPPATGTGQLWNNGGEVAVA